ncbi:MAG: right-handed parallel beta-helix repeat-containing protein [Pseudomonadota bacterium]
MSRIGKLTALMGAFVVTTVGAYAAPAAAQATRTWVSGVGDDANPCSRTAPCKTFAGAISKTAAGGEINCIDPGGFGAVSIAKAITIDCSDVQAGVVVAGTNGIIVNAGATDVVFLKGLDLTGTITVPGLNGVRFIAGAALHIEDSNIREFQSSNSEGVLFQPSGASELYLSSTSITWNGSGTTGGGVLIQPTGTGSAKVFVKNVLIQNNFNNGFWVNTTGNTGAGVQVSIEDTDISGGGQGLLVFAPASTTTATVMVNGSSINGNTTGIISNGAAAKVRVGGTTITSNGTGVVALGGSAINSYGDNRLDGNTANGTFTPPAAIKQ